MKLEELKTLNIFGVASTLTLTVIVNANMYYIIW